MIRWLKQKIFGLTFLLALLFAIYSSIQLYGRYQDPDRVAWMLNIKSPPPSLHVRGCDSSSWTDIVITCVVTISSEEFPLLLNGYSYNESLATCEANSCYNVPLPYAVNATVEYEARPKEFKYGGSVSLYADFSKKNVVINLYIE